MEPNIDGTGVISDDARAAKAIRMKVFINFQNLILF